MKRNKIILIIILLLVIVGFSYLLVSSFNSHDNLNVTNNSTTNKSINNSSLDMNNSLNETTLNDNSTYDESYYEESYYDDYSTFSGYSNSKSQSKSDDSSDEFSASDARSVVKDNLGGVDDYDISDLKIGKPKYKDSNGGWLVPLYDKKTDKFVDSVYAYPDGTSGGVQDHDDYKRIISGKKPKNTKSDVLNNRY